MFRKFLVFKTERSFFLDFVDNLFTLTVFCLRRVKIIKKI